MIWESHFWKSDLLRDINVIERWAVKKSSERQTVTLEKKIMISSYAMRKLIESRKVSDAVRGESATLIAFPSRSGNISYENWHHVDRFFDMDGGKDIIKPCFS